MYYALRDKAAGPSNKRMKLRDVRQTKLFVAESEVLSIVPKPISLATILTVTVCLSPEARTEPVECNETTEGLRLSHADGVILGREFRGLLMLRGEAGGSAKARSAKLIPCLDATCKEANKRYPTLEIGRRGHFKVKRNINTATSTFCRSGEIEEHHYVSEPSQDHCAE